MKFFITASRNFNNWKVFENNLLKMKNLVDSITIEGSKTEKPIDKFVKYWCKNCGCRLITDYPNWRPDGKYDKGAGLRQMNKSISDSDAAIIFWDGESRGTKMVIEKIIQLNKKYKVVKFKDPLSSYFIFSNKSSFLHYEYPCEVFDSRGNKFENAYEAYIRYKNSLTQKPSEIMRLVNKEKFKQHPNLMTKLTKLAEKNIIFDSKADPWGVEFTEGGLESLEDKNRNLLGKILNQIKSEGS